MFYGLHFVAFVAFLVKRYGQCELTNSVCGGVAHVGKGYGQCQLTTSARVGSGEGQMMQVLPLRLGKDVTFKIIC